MRQQKPPNDFSPDEAEIWTVAQRVLRAQGTWDRVDGHVLAVYARNVDLSRRAHAAARRHGVSTSIEARIVHKLARDADQMALSAAAQLLLTPAARRRAGIKPPAGARELRAVVR